jgi:hypothetical protein
MRPKLTDATSYILSKIPLVLLFIPLIYFGMLLAYAFIRYGNYYENDLAQLPFDFYSLVAGGVLSFVSLLTIYITLIQNHKNLLAKFLAKQKLEILFNSELLADLQREGQIEKVERLTGGYSGAQVYSFKRKGKVMPAILKVAEVAEVKNEHQKFNDHVDSKLICGPRKCHPYLCWGNYAGLEYDLNWSQASSDHLTFLEMYNKCLYDENIQRCLAVGTIEKVIRKLFKELEGSWWHPEGANDAPYVELQNIYEVHYPFTSKISKILKEIEKRFEPRQANSDLNASIWNRYYQALTPLLNVATWNNRRASALSYRFPLVRAVIHGDLNSRNVLLEVDPDNCYEADAIIRLVDFSYTGNGLTIAQTEKFNREGIRLDRNRGHIASDFCRLEADIKFCLTDLKNNRDLWQAWILECLLLQYGLELPNWSSLPPKAFARILEGQGLSNEVKWRELADPGCWQTNNARKFILAWQSVRAIRDSLREILVSQLPQGGPPPMQPFYLALLQASLPIIYYEDHRFHNPDLQKFYLVLASGLLCTRL